MHNWKAAARRYRAALLASCLKSEGLKRSFIWVLSHLSEEQLWLLDQLTEGAKAPEKVNSKGGRA